MTSSYQLFKQFIDEQRSLAVLDDFFPNILTAFRVAEYNWYLEHYANLTIYSTNPDFTNAHAAYAQYYPQYADRVKAYDKSSLDNCTLAYLMFLNNAYNFLPELTLQQVPFLMTLYPGGGFGLNEPESDAKLERVLASPLLHGIIATQSITVDYLRAKGCTVPIHDIYGGVINPIFFKEIAKRDRSMLTSDKIRICFVAERYMPQGLNKGYPQFIEAANKLIRESNNIQFSVVGSFVPDDYPIDEQLQEALFFKGLLTTFDLKEFYSTQHIIISPNSPFLLHQGNFDGFPTGCCVEASLCEVAVVCSDELKLNQYYTDGVNIIVCDSTPEAIVQAVRELINNPSKLQSIATNGQSISQAIFDPKQQLGQRSNLLSKALEEVESQWENKLIARTKSAFKTIADQANRLYSAEIKLSACNNHIISLEQTIADQTNHIYNVEAALMHYRNSLYGKCMSRLSRFNARIWNK